MSASSFPADSPVWGEWVPGRWFPGRVTQVRGVFRFVEFDDGDRGWLDTMRLVTPPDGPVPVLAPGQRVVAEWEPGGWYPGVIEEASDGLFFVRFDDGATGSYAPPQIRIGTGEPPVHRGPPERGARVDAQWRDGRWYPGVVTAIIGGDLRVDFDDGDVSTLAPAQTRLRTSGGPDLARSSPRGEPRLGEPVLACAGPRSRWREGIAESVAPPVAEIRFDDGSRATVTMPWVAIVADADPRFPPEGATVLAEWVPGHWYPGVMGRVVGPRGHVVYDDGTKAWLTPFMIAAPCG